MFLLCSKLARNGGTAQLAWKKGTPFCEILMFKNHYFAVVHTCIGVLRWFNNFLKNVSWGALLICHISEFRQTDCVRTVNRHKRYYGNVNITQHGAPCLEWQSMLNTQYLQLVAHLAYAYEESWESIGNNCRLIFDTGWYIAPPVLV